MHGGYISVTEGAEYMNWRILLGIIALGAAVTTTPARADDDEAPADGRQCSVDEERDGDRCYPLCKDDGYTRYEGDGDTCWQICPSNSQDYGHVCLMGPAQLKKKMFKRGPGRPLA